MIEAPEGLTFCGKLLIFRRIEKITNDLEIEGEKTWLEIAGDKTIFHFGDQMTAFNQAEIIYQPSQELVVVGVSNNQLLAGYLYYNLK